MSFSSSRVTTHKHVKTNTKVQCFASDNILNQYISIIYYVYDLKECTNIIYSKQALLNSKSLAI